MAAWVYLTATGGLLGGTLIANTIHLMHEDYNSQVRHQFPDLHRLRYCVSPDKYLRQSSRPTFTQAAFLWSLAGFVVVCISVFACASPNYQSGEFVYGKFINDVGWPDGMAWLLGLLQGALELTGFDATVHMIEEILKLATTSFKIVICYIGIGMFNGWVLVSCLMFVMKNVVTAGPLV